MSLYSIKVVVGDTTHGMMTEEFKLILEAAAFTTAKVIREIKEQPLVSLVEVDKNNPRHLDTSRLKSELKTYRNLQKRMCTITDLLNEIERAEKPEVPCK